MDPLHAAKDAAAGLSAQGLRAVRPEQFIGSNFQGGGKANGHFRGEAELATFVIGNQGLNNADAFGKFGLGIAAFFSEPGDALVQWLAAGLDSGMGLRSLL